MQPRYARGEFGNVTIVACDSLTKKHNREFSNHDIQLVAYKTWDFHQLPEQLRGLERHQDMTSDTIKQLIQEYKDYHDSSEDVKISAFAISFLERFLTATASLKKPNIARTFIFEYQKEKGYHGSTLKKLISALKKFATWTRQYKRTALRYNPDTLDGEITWVARKINKQASAEQIKNAKKKFEKVPDLKRCAEVRLHVLALLDGQSGTIGDQTGTNEDQTGTNGNQTGIIRLSYYEYMPLVVFCLLTETNCRFGSLLNIKLEAYKKLEPGELVITTDHKTGSHYPNFIHFTDIMKRHIKKCLQLLSEEAPDFKPTYLFSPKSGTSKFSSQARYLKTAMSKHLGIQDEDFNPNAVRKAWDTMYAKKQLFEAGQCNLYEMNSGHSAATRSKYYVKPPSDVEIEKFLERQRDLMNNPDKLNDLPDAVEKPGPSKTAASTRQDMDVAESDEEQSDLDENTEEVPQEPPETVGETDSTLTLTGPQEQISEDMDLGEVSSEADDDEDFKNVKIEPKITLGVKNTRAMQMQRMAVIRTRLLSFKGPPTTTQNLVRKVCEKVSEKNYELSKTMIRDIVRSQHVAKNQVEVITNKVYTKYRNIINALEKN